MLGLLGAVVFVCGTALGFGAVVWSFVAFDFGERGTASFPPILYWKIGTGITGVTMFLYAVVIWPILNERDFYREELRRMRADCG